jgi:hypothetical protein
VHFGENPPAHSFASPRSSVAEQPAVNRHVAGPNPAEGAAVTSVLTRTAPLRYSPRRAESR